MNSEGVEVLIIEPFYTGSHKGLIDVLSHTLGSNALCYTMKGIKWPWRARTSALYFSQEIIEPLPVSVKSLFASSVLNLAELCALRTDVAKLRKVLYFHENQLVYPKQQQKERDFQYGYNQILSCLVADIVLFNSEFNKTSFLCSIKSFMKIMPDYRPKHLDIQIEPKCKVVYYPIEFPMPQIKQKCCQCLHILWPHRWEHDKDPQKFFEVLFKLKSMRVPFKVSVLGENYPEKPVVFEEAKHFLRDEIVNWGFVESREKYWSILESCDVVVSTSKHEFFGVAMLEAAFKGCFPLCPNSLVYPEIFPVECLYNTGDELYYRLKDFATKLDSIPKVEIDFEKYTKNKIKWHTLLSIYDWSECNLYNRHQESETILNAGFHNSSKDMRFSGLTKLNDKTK